MSYLVNFVWGNNMQKRKSIVNENDELIVILQVQKKDLAKILEFNLDLIGEIKQIYDLYSNLNLEEYIDITSPNIISFVISSNWVVDEDIYMNFSETELEIAISKVQKIINELETKNVNNEFSIEIEKYKYMLEDINSIKKEKNKCI